MRDETEPTPAGLRYGSKIIAATLTGQDSAATLARTVPGLPGLILFCASRGDAPANVARWLGIPVEHLDEILREAEMVRA